MNDKRLISLDLGWPILSSGLQVVSLTSSHPLTLVLIHSANDEHDISNWIDKTRMLAINVSINHNSLKYLLFTFLIIGEWWCSALWLIGQKFKNSNWPINRMSQHLNWIKSGSIHLQQPNPHMNDSTANHFIAMQQTNA